MSEHKMDKGFYITWDDRTSDRGMYIWNTNTNLGIQFDFPDAKAFQSFLGSKQKNGILGNKDGSTLEIINSDSFFMTIADMLDAGELAYHSLDITMQPLNELKKELFLRWFKTATGEELPEYSAREAQRKKKMTG